MSFDCADPQALGEFWAAMLDGELIPVRDGVIVIRTDWVWMSVLRVPDYVAPTWPAATRRHPLRAARRATTTADGR